jgi:hypothetical protein
VLLPRIAKSLTMQNRRDSGEQAGSPSFLHSRRSWVRFRLRDVLAEGLSRKASELVICNGKADLDGFAAYLAVFNVGLAADGQVQYHRNFFSTVWTGEFVFH